MPPSPPLLLLLLLILPMLQLMLMVLWLRLVLVLFICNQLFNISLHAARRAMAAVVGAF